jgi:hypothetical protein
MDDQMSGVVSQAAAMGAAAVQAIQDEVGVLSQLQLNIASGAANAAIAAKVSTEFTDSKAPILVANLQNIMDGKVFDERTLEILSQWAKDVNTGVKVA